MDDPHTQAAALAAIATWQPAVICAELELSEFARACLAQSPVASSFLSMLLRADCHRDAVTFLAHALPRRQAVRWACDCVEAGAELGLPEAACAAVAAARNWVVEPTAARCQAAATAAEGPGLDRDGGGRFAAFAAAWSGQSLAPEGQPVVAPAPALGAAAVCAAVMLAAAAGSPGGMDVRLRDFIGRGMLSASPPG